MGILVLGGAIVYAFAHRVFANERRLAGISHELETARRIQSSILPRTMPEVRGIALAARYLPGRRAVR